MDLAWVVAEASRAGATYADARLQEIRSTSLEWRDGEVKKAVPGRETGVGIRVLADGAWGVASTNRGTKGAVRDALERAAASARALGRRAGEKVRLAPVTAARDEIVLRPKVDATGIALEEKARLFADAERAAREEPAVTGVRIGLEDSVTRTTFWSSEGARLATEVPRILLQYDLVARGDGGAIVGYRARIGATAGWEVFADRDPLAKAREAAAGAARLLTAKPSPSGRMPVIADPDLAGVFAHEAIGHACEADLVLAGESLLEGRIGEKLGSEQVSIVDDGGVPGGFGSLPYDDEGVRAGRKRLLTKGFLTGYILSRETAGKLGMEPNGGARAQSYAVPPLVRMSNTLIEPGAWEFDEMVRGVKRGILAKGTRGGQVDVAKGTFQFGAQEAWLIENGEITRPLRDVALQGSILETLRDIDAVGRKAELASPGICGKGQLVPVGDGGPHIRIQNAVVGGGE